MAYIDPLGLSSEKQNLYESSSLIDCYITAPEEPDEYSWYKLSNKEKQEIIKEFKA
jgi:hypothetical protein